MSGPPGTNCQASPPSSSFTSFGARSWNFLGSQAVPDVGRLDDVAVGVDQSVLAHGVLLRPVGSARRVLDPSGPVG